MIEVPERAERMRELVDDGAGRVVIVLGVEIVQRVVADPVAAVVHAEQPGLIAALAAAGAVADAVALRIVAAPAVDVPEILNGEVADGRGVKRRREGVRGRRRQRKGL